MCSAFFVGVNGYVDASQSKICIEIVDKSKKLNSIDQQNQMTINLWREKKCLIFHCHHTSRVHWIRVCVCVCTHLYACVDGLKSLQKFCNMKIPHKFTHSLCNIDISWEHISFDISSIYSNSNIPQVTTHRAKIRKILKEILKLTKVKQKTPPK